MLRNLHNGVLELQQSQKEINTKLNQILAYVKTFRQNLGESEKTGTGPRRPKILQR